MTYENVDIDVTLDDFVKKIMADAVSIEFKIKWHNTHKKTPFFNDMREDLKENENWQELQDLDYSGKLPTLRYKDNTALINELINAVRDECLELDKTEIRYLREHRGEYYSGKGNNLKMVMRYTGN